MNGDADWATAQKALDSVIQWAGSLKPSGSPLLNLPALHEAAQAAHSPSGMVAAAIMAILLLEQAKLVITRPDPRFSKLVDDVIQSLRSIPRHA